jgi:putative hemolysin
VDDALPGIVGLVLLLGLSFFLTAARSALANARRQDLREMAEKGNRQASLAAALAEDSSRLLGTFHLANILAYFLLASLAISLFVAPTGAWLEARLAGINGMALSYLLIALGMALVAYLLTEMLPELLVHGDPDQWAMVLAMPANVTLVILSPVVWIATTLRRLLAAPLGSDHGSVTEEEIMTLVDAGEEEGSIQLGEKEMIYSIFQLDDTVAREIMIPRIDIVAVDVNTTLEQAREVIINAGHSRIPVYEESLDHIVGLVYAKDLIGVWHRGEQKVNLRSLLRPALFIPESKHVPDLLRELQNSKVHMAVVIDEYGGTAGLVTLEDIVEEIVGEIQDEYDVKEEVPFQRIGQDEYIFDARINLDDFNHMMDMQLPDELSDTLGGFIYAELGKIPDSGDTIQTGSVLLEVLNVEDRRIRKVRAKRIERDEPPTTGQNTKDQIANGSSSNGR